jgi:hypothetical protein
VYPAVEGLMIGLELSQDNKFAAAYTNNNQTVILNTLVSEFVIIDNPFKPEVVPEENEEGKEKGEKLIGKKLWKKGKKRMKAKVVEKEKKEDAVEEDDPLLNIQGMVLLEGSLVVYSPREWRTYNMAGKLQDRGTNPADNYILNMKILSLTDLSIVSWSGDQNDPTMGLQSVQEGEWSPLVPAHSGIVLNGAQTRAYLCAEPGSSRVSRWERPHGEWEQAASYGENTAGVLMLSLSVLETWVISTATNGFHLWHVENRQSRVLSLPNGVRNVCKRRGVSSDLVLSAQDKYAVAGIRKELYIWDLGSEQLSKVCTLYVHCTVYLPLKSQFPKISI